MQDPKVSIIIRTKNEERWISHCIKRIHTQTYKNYEIIVVDDNSSDNTLKIIKKNYSDNNVVLDPHTAVGVGVVNKLSFNDCVVLSTAHPCKFPNATNNAINKHEKLPIELLHVLDQKERFHLLKNNTEEVKNFIKSKI